VVDFADDTSTELERKAEALKWVALVEGVSYFGLAAFWLSGNKVGTVVFGSVHGWIFLAFAAMVLMIRRDMEWSWPFAIVGIVAGPLGPALVYERIRRRGVPEHARRRTATPRAVHTTLST
jgi:integral membrane protein